MLKYMMVEYATFKQDCELLRQMHYLEVVAKRGDGYQMDDEAYEMCGENLRILMAYSEDEDPVGYCVTLITPNPHDSGAVLAVTDMFFLEERYRKGFNGLELLRAAELDLSLAAPGATWRVAVPIDAARDMGLLMERSLHMDAVERVYQKRLEAEG